MITRIIAASLFSLTLATSVMAQGVGNDNSGNTSNSGQSSNGSGDDATSSGPTNGASGTEGAVGSPPADSCPVDGMKKDASGNMVKCTN